MGALVWRRDGDTSVVKIVHIDFVIGTIINNNVASNKSEHKRYYNA